MYWRNDPTALSLFLTSLDNYEASVPDTPSDPYSYEQPSQHLQMAVDRMIHASSVDAFQMMRHLTSRMFYKSNTSYSSYNLLMISSGSGMSIARDNIFAVTNGITAVLNDQSAPLDDYIWLSNILMNKGIIGFLETYAGSDLQRQFKVLPGNTVLSAPDVVVSETDDEQITLSLGVTNLEVSLTSTNYQCVMFVKADDLTYSSDLRSDLPTMIAGTVTLRPGLGEVYIDKRVIVNAGVVSSMTLLGSLETPYVAGQDLRIKLPGYFYSTKLDVVSFDSGETWEIGNLQIFPPSMKTQ